MLSLQLCVWFILHLMEMKSCNCFFKSPVLLGSKKGGRNTATNFFAAVGAALKSTHLQH